MATDLKIQGDCPITSCLGDQENVFLGSSREFTYFVRWFQDGWHKQMQPPSFYADYKDVSTTKGAYRNTWFSKGPIDPAGFVYQGNVPDMECVSWSHAYYNLFLLKNKIGETKKNDVIEFDYYHGTISQEVTTFRSASVVKWRDTGYYLGSYSPLFISFWLGCCCLPCMPCAYTGHQCNGSLEFNFNAFTDQMDNYWAANDSFDPFPWDGFFTDYKGRIARGPEPVIGWVRAILFFPPDCDYCGCPLLACLIKDCADAWFAYRSYVSKIFFFNRNSGIPFKDKQKIEDFGKNTQSQFNFGNIDIKLDHLADEKVFVMGLADFNNGNIKFDNTSLLGDYISDITTFDVNEAGYREASFTIRSGEPCFIRGAINGTNDWPDDFKPPLPFKGTELRAASVRNKNQKYFPEMRQYGWIYVDIPEPVEELTSEIKFAIDIGDVPDTALRSCPNMGCDLPRTCLDLRTETFFCRTQSKNGEYVPFPRCNYDPTDYDNDLLNMFPVKYYKKYSIKLVKAPHNLYLKSGEGQFRYCLLGQTLRDLEPGRYYFPNAGCQNIFSPISAYDPEVPVPYDTSEDNEFQYAFTNKLHQYTGPNKIYLDDPEGQLRYAKSLLGSPYEQGNAIQMEIQRTLSAGIAGQM